MDICLGGRIIGFWFLLYFFVFFKCSAMDMCEWSNQKDKKLFMYVRMRRARPSGMRPLQCGDLWEKPPFGCPLTAAFSPVSCLSEKRAEWGPGWGGGEGGRTSEGRTGCRVGRGIGGGGDEQFLSFALSCELRNQENRTLRAVFLGKQALLWGCNPALRVKRWYIEKEIRLDPQDKHPVILTKTQIGKIWGIFVEYL